MDLLEREGPLRKLGEALHAAAAGDGSVVLVTGEPGIGKTALVTHFAESLGGGGRVWRGMCDDLSIPRPLGPLRDMAGSFSAPLARALNGGAEPAELHALLIEELNQPPTPTVLVLEDVHWADDATLDVITVLGRRVATLSTLVVLTFRDSDVAVGHRLRVAVGAIPPTATCHLPIHPLSRDAVARLTGDAADRVYAMTKGNPFFVTELLAAKPDELPPSVSDAVLARAALLDGTSRRLIELVSVVPARIETALLDTLMPAWVEAAEEPERRQLLEVDSRSVRFRHELARVAIASSLPTARRRRLHAEILGALLASDAEAADIVHHAEAAGDIDVVAEHALVAARQAAAVASNRQAYAHFRRAAEFDDRLAPSEQAALFEELATAAYTVDQLDDALWAIERAIAVHHAASDGAAVGRCTRMLSRLHWYVGSGEQAWATARRAIEMLEPLGDSIELARAYSGLSQLAMLSVRPEETLLWGQHAVAMAERLGDERTRAHALVNIGAARTDIDPDDTATLLEAHAVADAAGDHHEAVRAMLNLAYHEMCWVHPEPARRYGARARDYAAEHEVDTLGGYTTTMLAWLRLRAGEWDEAERVASGELAKGSTVAQILAKTVLAELAVRRGDADAADRLDDVGAQADRTGELQRVGPVLELETEWSLTAGAPLPLDRFRRAEAIAASLAPAAGWAVGRLAAWAVVADLAIGFNGRMPRPHEAMYRGDWAGAADAFGAVGWGYDRALMLSLLDERPALLEALETARGLGAAPLAGRVSRRLREFGHRVPHGSLESTRSHPAGLTSRQLEVLRLLAEGLTNAEIAERLVVSPRTAEHHVSAVLTKLGVTSRREAARRAAGLLAARPAAVGP